MFPLWHMRSCRENWNWFNICVCVCVYVSLRARVCTSMHACSLLALCVCAILCMCMWVHVCVSLCFVWICWHWIVWCKHVSCVNSDVRSCFEWWSALSQSSWIRCYIRVTCYYYKYVYSVLFVCLHTTDLYVGICALHVFCFESLKVFYKFPFIIT